MEERPTRISRRALLAAWSGMLGTSACGAAPEAPARPAPVPSSSSAPPTAAAAAPRFAFHSGFWLNLHLWIHYAATGRRPAPARAPAPPAGAAWDDAVRYYGARFGERGGFGLIFDEELVGLGRRLSDLGSAPSPSGIDAELARHLEAVATLVRPGWDALDRDNHAWIAAVEPGIARHGGAMRDALVRIYGVPWETSPIRVDVSAFAGPVGAYTVSGPAHTIITSADPTYAGDASLEMIFHEASHLLSDPLEKMIEAAAAKRGRETPRDLWHAIVFFVAGEVAKSRLGASYVPYVDKNGMWARWSAFEAPVRRECRPVVDGTATLDAAVMKIVDALPADGPPQP